MRNDSVVIDILAQHRRERRIAAVVFIVLLLALAGLRVSVPHSATPPIPQETAVAP